MGKIFSGSGSKTTAHKVKTTALAIKSPVGKAKAKAKVAPLMAVAALSPTGRPQRQAGLKAQARTLALMAQVKNRSVSAVARSTEPIPGAATQGLQPVDKSYKAGTARYHWKGKRDVHGLTSGNIPFLGTRDSKGWTPAHVKRRDALSALLPTRHRNIVNPFGMAHLAENSHLHAGSFYGVNDVLSAPPASIHQNTEWLAIESGIKKLSRKADSDPGFGELRMKSTGYVFDSGPNQGFLRASRYKVYIGGKKVFDHVSDGLRGNIDKDESRHLEQKVAALSGLSPLVNLHHSAVRGVHGAAPTLLEAMQGQRSGTSDRHPQFTDLRKSDGTRLQGGLALDYAKSLYPT